MRHTSLLAGLLLAAILPAAAMARDVTHAMGTTDVPDAPQRIVILTNEGTEALLDLGVTPLAAVQSTVGDPWYPHIAEAMAGVEVVGNEDAPNLEAIAALEPDLILGIKVRHEAIYPQLSAIAPTVFSEVLEGQWQNNYRLYAEALGLAEMGEARLADFDATVATLRERLGERIDEDISLVRFRAGGRTSIRAANSFAGMLIEEIGFARPPLQAALDDSVEVTKERIPEMDGDRIFYFTRDAGDGEGVAVEAEWTVDPLWLGLDAVKAGQAHRVDDAVWNIAGGVLAARLVLDDIAGVYGIELD